MLPVVFAAIPLGSHRTIAIRLGAHDAGFLQDYFYQVAGHMRRHHPRTEVRGQNTSDLLLRLLSDFGEVQPYLVQVTFR